MEKNELARLTVDIPLEVHKKLKVIAALSNKSMRDVIVDLIVHNLNTKEIISLLEK